MAALVLQDMEVSQAEGLVAEREAVARVLVRTAPPEDAGEHFPDWALADPLEAAQGQVAEVEAPEVAPEADREAVVADSPEGAGQAEEEVAEAAPHQQRGTRVRISAR